MEEKRFVYLLGIIKWVNLMTLFLFMSNIFAFMGIPPVMAIVIQLLLVAIISILINKWFEKKFGRQNLIENTLAFKIINALIIVSVFIVLLVSKQYTYLIIILVYMALFSMVLFAINKSNKRGKGRPV